MQTSSRSGNPELGGRAYQYLEKIVDPDVVKAALLKRYGAKLDKPEFRSSKPRSDAEDLANQFMCVYNDAFEQKQRGQKGTAPIDSQPSDASPVT